MKFVPGACLLLVLASPVRLEAQEDVAPQESSIILMQGSLPELEQPAEGEPEPTPLASPAESVIPESATPSEILPSLPPMPTADWVQNLRVPRREHPQPLTWWDGDGGAADEGSWLSRQWAGTWADAHDTCHRLWRDFQYQYSLYPLCELGIAVGLVAPLANTNADQAIANWYQNRVRGTAGAAGDRMANVGYMFGTFQYMLPMYFGVWGVGKMMDDTWLGSVSSEWANRAARATAIGAPEVGLLQYVLGASRPADDIGSRWHPLKDNNGASGHAFVGAIPFLTAASMTDRYWLRGVMMMGSTWSAWSRMNTDSHYLSQVLLGWFIAYQSVRSVNRTEAEERQVQVGPWIDPGITGINVFLRY